MITCNNFPISDSDDGTVNDSWDAILEVYEKLTGEDKARFKIEMMQYAANMGPD